MFPQPDGARKRFLPCRGSVSLTISRAVPADAAALEPVLRDQAILSIIPALRFNFNYVWPAGTDISVYLPALKNSAAGLIHTAMYTRIHSPIRRCMPSF